MCSNCDSTPDHTPEAAPKDIAEDGYELTVQGMTCTSCAAKVSSAVEGVTGVTGTDVNLETGTIQVRGHDIDEHEVRDAVTAVGYQVG